MTHGLDLEAEDAQILHRGVTRMDRIRNERIKGEVKVEQAGDKIAEARLRWL